MNTKKKISIFIIASSVIFGVYALGEEEAKNKNEPKLSAKSEGIYRSDLIEKCITVIKGIPDDAKVLTHEQLEAVQILGEYRCDNQRALEILVKHMMIKRPQPKETKRIWMRAPINTATEITPYPCAEALSKIGVWGVRFLMIASDKNGKDWVSDKKRILLYKIILGQNLNLKHTRLSKTLLEAAKKKATDKKTKEFYDKVMGQ